MTSKNTLGLLVLAGLGSLGTSPAFAQRSAQDGPYWYGGLSVGEARARIDTERIASTLLGAGITATSFSTEERDPAYRLFGGYQINRYFGLEASYHDLGRFGFNAATSPAGALNGQIRLRGAGLDLVGTLPLSDRWSVLGRVGAQSTQAHDRFTGLGAVAVLDATPGKRETNVKWGAGLQYEVSRSFMVRVEGESYRVNDAVGNHGTVNVASLSLVFPFGRSDSPRAMRTPVALAPPPPPPAPQPMPVAVAPPPPVAVAPAPAPVPMAPQRRRVSFSAETLFGFDQATLQPDGRAALDKFAADTRGTQFDVITVEGHTDRLGTAEYNQRLSQRRADAVKAYLVSSGGFSADKVNVVGKGEGSPVTKAEDCRGNRQTAKLIACLKADRRVDIEVSGLR